jgi:signal transduction histidine kinase
VTGWAIAVALALDALRLRRRLELVARAEHELRGPLTAFGLGLESARRGRPVAGVLYAELERARTALADLSAARRGRRALAAPRRLELERLARSSAAAWGARLEWRAGAARVDGDAGRLAQALGNLLANAAEHGAGDVVLRAERAAGRGGVRLEVANADAARGPADVRDRGRGLAIAAAAARSAGGRLATRRAGGEFRAILDLPLAG